MAILRSTRRTGWIALGVAAACALSLAYLLRSTALDKNTADWAKAFLFALGVVALLATLVASDGMPWRARTLTAWLQPRPLSALFVALFVAFGVMTDALSLFEPRPVVESAPGVIEENTNAILKRLPPPGPVAASSRIMQRIGGHWGRRDCAVMYRFAVQGDALIIDWVRRPLGEPPYQVVATILVKERDRMEVRGEEPEGARGRAATFTYTTNGRIERLTWDDQDSRHPTELDRCG
jgi:hypothetical protein